MNQAVRSFLILCGMLAVGGCVATSPIKQAEPAAATLVTMQPITYVVPIDEGVIRQRGVIEDLSFADFSSGSKDHRDTLRTKRVREGSIVIERRTDNGVAGSGKQYRVDFTVEKDKTHYKTTLQPISYSTYQQGLILPFPIPMFSDRDLSDHLLSAQVHYRLEINSEFNSESTHANFMRILKTRSFRSGEKDPVTGKVFKQEFVLPYRGKEVLFVLETFPYRNGSKAVIYLRVPAVATSPNTVDYKAILDELKAKLIEVVRA